MSSTAAIALLLWLCIAALFAAIFYLLKQLVSNDLFPQPLQLIGGSEREGERQ